MARSAVVQSLQRSAGNRAAGRFAQRTATSLIQRRPKPDDGTLWTKMGKVTGVIESSKGTCQASAAKLYNKFVGWGYVDGRADISGVLLMWRAGERGEPWNHTAISVHWDEGDFIVDATISQFGLSESIFIGSEAEWIERIKSGDGAQVRDLRGLEVSRKQGGVYANQEMDTMLREFGERYNDIEAEFNETATPIGAPDDE